MSTISLFRLWLLTSASLNAPFVSLTPEPSTSVVDCVPPKIIGAMVTTISSTRWPDIIDQLRAPPPSRRMFLIPKWHSCIRSIFRFTCLRPALMTRAPACLSFSILTLGASSVTAIITRELVAKIRASRGVLAKLSTIIRVGDLPFTNRTVNLGSSCSRVLMPIITASCLLLRMCSTTKSLDEEIFE